MIHASTGAPPAPRLPKFFALRDLDIAPENVRFAEAPDDAIPQLAATILAAGVLQPLTVRPGRRKEARGMVLDGRRRLLALRTLLAEGALDESYGVPAYEETEPGRQAAALLLTNTAVPVHIADVIVAIGRMLKARLTPAAIAAALGYAEVEIRRLAALAGLHPKAIEALRAGTLTLRQARLLARLPDAATQAELAQSTLDGYGFPEWRVTERLDAGQVTTADSRFPLVGAERYAQAGGRTERDLFGERADVLLDADLLQAAWAMRAEEIAQALACEGREVRISVDGDELAETGDALEPFGCAYGLGLDDDGLEAWRQAESAEQAARTALAGRDLASREADADISAFLLARLAAGIASEPPRPATLVQVVASARTGLDLWVYGPGVEDAVDDRPAEAEDDDDIQTQGNARAGSPPTDLRPVAFAATMELDGVGHALHEVRSDLATRALIRGLVDQPQVALIAVTARLFDLLVRNTAVGRGGGALALSAQAYGRASWPAIAALDGEVRHRLAGRSADWQASGRTVIAWVNDLAADDRLALLAELAALSLDLREERTSQPRPGARAEAAELAALCALDVNRWWTPDERFLRAHSKPQLLAMLAAMEALTPGAQGCKKDELIALVVAQAAERAWAPPELSWKAAAEPEAPAPASDDADTPPWDGEAQWPEGDAEDGAIAA